MDLLIWAIPALIAGACVWGITYLGKNDEDDAA